MEPDPIRPAADVYREHEDAATTTTTNPPPPEDDDDVAATPPCQRRRRRQREERERQVEDFLAFFEDPFAGYYRRAVSTAPELVRRETPLDVFLRRESDDPSGAARRLCRYWRLRYEYFGEERWLRPMNCTGTTGALDEADAALLRSGFMWFLPLTFCHDVGRHGGGDRSTTKNQWNPSEREDTTREAHDDDDDDTTDRPVAFWLTDRSRLPAWAAAAESSWPALETAAVRLILYASTIYPKHEFRLLSVVRRESAGDHFKCDMGVRLRVRDAIAAVGVSDTFARTFDPRHGRVLTTERPVVRRRLSKLSFDRLPIAYVAETSSKSTLDALVARGFCRAALPQSLGGDLDPHEAVHAWIRRRLSVEDVLGATASPVVNAEWTNRTNRDQNAAAQRRQRQAQQWLFLLQQQQQQQRFYLQSQEQSQQPQGHASRQSPAATTMDTPENADRKKPSQQQPRSKVERLPHESWDEYTRRRNGIYWQRFNERRQRGEFALRAEHKERREINRTLRAEGKRLEALLSQARACVERHQPRQTRPVTVTVVNSANTAPRRTTPHLMDDEEIVDAVQRTFASNSRQPPQQPRQQQLVDDDEIIRAVLRSDNPRNR